MSNGIQGAQFIVWVIILAIAPIIGSFFISALNLLIDREIPPILPQINTQSFGQAIVAIVVLALLSQTFRAGYFIADLVVILLLFGILVAQAWIDKRQQAQTQDHVRKVLREKLVTKASRENLPILLDVARAMIDIDYFPDSITNRLSGYPRKARRNQFIGFVTECLNKNGNEKIEITEEELLIPEDARRELNTAYVIFTGISLLLYVGSILLTIFGQI